MVENARSLDLRLSGPTTGVPLTPECGEFGDVIPPKSSLKWFTTERRALYYEGAPGGPAGDWVDGAARWGTGVDHPDQEHHLAKVRVAGANPVFGSKQSPGSGPGSGMI